MGVTLAVTTDRCLDLLVCDPNLKYGCTKEYCSQTAVTTVAAKRLVKYPTLGIIYTLLCGTYCNFCVWDLHPG